MSKSKLPASGEAPATTRKASDRNPTRVGVAALLTATMVLGLGCEEGPFLVSGVVIGSLAISPTALNVAEMEVDSVTLEVFDDEGVEVTGQAASWVSENPTVATVMGDSDGATVFGVAEGTTRIRATVGNVSEFVDVTVFSSAFDIEIRYLGTEPPASQQIVFEQAARFWRSAIIGDLADFSANVEEGDCAGVAAPAVQEVIDDLVIFVEMQDIDGPGGTLGAAAPCWLRSADLTPFIGGMALDNADVANLEANGGLETTIRHEMGHVLGFGTLWGAGFFNLLVNPSDPDNGGVRGADAHFDGPLAVAAFNGAGGAGYGGAKVPVENDADTYGSGSLDGHFREGVMGTELMTPSINGGVPNPASLITIQSLADLGYVVNTSAAEPYTVTNPLLSLQGSPARQIWLGDDIARGPIRVVDEQGRVVRVVRR